MAPFPLPLESLIGKGGMFAVFLLIGFFFGYVLEISGFGVSNKIAGLFYFKDATVFKVFFTAMLVAATLIFWATAIGLLDYNAIWVNPTYLWPGILGGLIMGVGFVVGGFCPGTSLVALGTGKLDGAFFALGLFVGIFGFGETVQYFEDWGETAGYMGRFTLQDWLGVSYGTVLFFLMLIALALFIVMEKLEQRFGGADPKREPRIRWLGAGVLVLAAFGLMAFGQPDALRKWERIAPEKQPLLDQRQVQIAPGELLATWADDRLQLIMIDVRSEADYNKFHLQGARHIPLAELPAHIPNLLLEASDHTVIVVMSNDEQAATEAWKMLVAESVPNVYILEGGVNGWLDVFAEEDESIQPIAAQGPDQLRYTFPAAMGDRYNASFPDPHQWLEELEYTPKIKLERKRGPTGGGCG